MEGELWPILYAWVTAEAKLRPRPERVRYGDGVILLVVLWAALHDRPLSWACRAQSWGGEEALPWESLPSPATLSRAEPEAAAASLAPQLTGAGYVLGDVPYDSNPAYAALAARGLQLLAARKCRGAGLGHGTGARDWGTGRTPRSGCGRSHCWRRRRPAACRGPDRPPSRGACTGRAGGV